MIHKQLVITGQVHGVFFRQTALQKAHELNIKGWIRNDASGTVTASVEGEEKDVFTFIEWSKQGPPNAKVDGVITEDKPLENFYHFEIKR